MQKSQGSDSELGLPVVSLLSFEHFMVSFPWSIRGQIIKKSGGLVFTQ